MALNPGQTSGLVKSAFGYHIIQTEQKQAAGTKPLAEVKDSIVQILQQQKQGAAEQQFAQQLAAEAKKNGLDKTAAAHGLHVVTTDYVAKDGVIGGLSDATALLAQAFSTDKGAAPGDGFYRRRLRCLPGGRRKAGTRSGFRRATRPMFWTTIASRSCPQLMAACDQQAGRSRQGAERPEESGGRDEGRRQVQRPRRSGWTGDRPGRDERSRQGGLLAAQGRHLGRRSTQGQAGVVLTVLDKQEPTADDIAKNLDATREQLLNTQREQIFRVFLGTLIEEV